MYALKSKKIWHLIKLPALIGVILIIAGLYWYGAVEQLTRVNTDMHTDDQSAYMDYARKMNESNYTYIGGRNRMPVYPFFQSLFYRPGMTEEAFFIRGKYINLILSLVLLAGLALIFIQYLSWLQSLNLLLIVAFTVFIFKAGFFQVECLFYFVNFCLFLLMWKLLQKVSWQLAIFTGVVAGLAHLTKASILPGLLIFLVVAGIKWVWITLQSLFSTNDSIPAKVIFKQVMVIILVGGFFLITVFPYISTSKRIFGHYFYNVSSTFYIWYDSWEEAEQGTKAHGDRFSWPDMPPEELPSMSKYWREHTLQQIIGRFGNGARRLLWEAVYSPSHSYGYFKYIVIYMCLLAIAILWFWQQARQAVKSNFFLFMFLVIYFGSYLVLYFWFAGYVSANRYILSQFIPLMFTISYGLHTLLRSSQLKIKGHSVSTLNIINLLILPVVVTDIYFILTERIITIYGGR